MTAQAKAEVGDGAILRNTVNEDAKSDSLDRDVAAQMEIVADAENITEKMKSSENLIP